MIDKVAGIIIQKKKLLIVREYDYKMFFIPGGTREGSETDEETLRREMKEETGAYVTNVKFYKEFLTPNHDNTDKLKVRAYFADVIGDVKPGNEIEQTLWVGRDDYTKVTLGNALKVIIPQLIKDGLM
jgi:8-oxo-dGTP diphosphatase